jgi:sugar lactone lactonase YvrE
MKLTKFFLIGFVFVAQTFVASSLLADILFVSSFGSNNIYTFDTALGSGSQSTFAVGLNHPNGLAFDSTGNLFEADGGSGNIYEFTPGGSRSTFASGLSNPQPLAFDSSGNLYAGNGLAPSTAILKFTPGGSRSTFANASPNFVFGLAIDRSSNLFASIGNGIKKITPDGTQSFFATGNAGLAFDSHGNLFASWVSNSSGGIYEYVNTGGILSSTPIPFASGLNNPDGLAFDSSGNLFEADRGSGNIYEFINTNGSLSSTPTLFASGLNSPTFLTFRPIPIISWTNTAGGNWNVATNWSPNQVPGSADNAVITANGSYTVTLDISPTVGSLTLGGTSGTQTVATTGNTLTLNNTSVVNSNGVLSLNGGTFSGVGPLAINGQLNWTNFGFIDPGSTLTVGTNGVLVLALAGGDTGQLKLRGVLTNAGTIKLVSGTLTLQAFNGGLGQLINLPGALVDIQADGLIDIYNGTELIANAGTVRKSGGTGTSTIRPIFNNTGTLDAQSGIVNIVGGGDGNGVFQAEAGATSQFSGNYTASSGAQFTGAGTNLFFGATFTLNGTIISSNAVLAGATLAGTNGVITGILTWTNSGFIDPGSTLTVGTNGVLVLALAGGDAGQLKLRGVLTNAGTIKLVSGTLTLQAFIGGPGQLINLPGALMDIQADGLIDIYNGTELIANAGTVRKSGGAGISTIRPIFNNTGTLDAQSGTVSLFGGYSLTNGTLNFGISSLTSFGKINLSSSPATLAGSVGANLNNGYVPANGNSFTVVTYGSYTGMFTNTALPVVALWQTNYSSTAFTISVAGVNKLAFTTQPVGGKMTNLILAPVVVQVENPGGNPIATNGVPVTISLNSGSGTLNGTLTQNTDPTGKATFSDLSFNQTGTKTLLGSAPALTSATSTPFDIVPLIGMQWSTNGFQLELNGTNSLGSTIIYASTNLTIWTPIYTNGPTNGAIIFLDPDSVNLPYRFYKIVQYLSQ